MRGFYSLSPPTSNMVACNVTTLKLSTTVAVQIAPAVSSLLAFRGDSRCCGNNWYCLDLFDFCRFQARAHHRMTWYNSLFMRRMRVWSRFGRWSKKRCPRRTAANLPGGFSWQRSLDLRCSKVYHPDIPRDKQAAKPPTARASAPAGRGIVNVHSTMLLLSVLGSFFLLSSLKANNFLISKVV